LAPPFTHILAQQKSLKTFRSLRTPFGCWAAKHVRKLLGGAPRRLNGRLVIVVHPVESRRLGSNSPGLLPGCNEFQRPLIVWGIPMVHTVPGQAAKDCLSARGNGSSILGSGVCRGNQFQGRSVKSRRATHFVKEATEKNQCLGPGLKNMIVPLYFLGGVPVSETTQIY